MAPTLTAVVTAFWPERFENVERIVLDLQRCERPPDTLIVLNNNPEHPDRFDHFEGIRQVKGSNWECRGKYVAGLLAFADYYLLNDDDITVGRQTTAELMRRAHPECITANRGIVIGPDRSFYRGRVVDADKVHGPDIRVDSLCGSSLFTSHAALLRTLDLEKALRHKWPTEGDDIIAGLANEAYIWPMQGDRAWSYLDTGGVAMNLVPGYYEMRDEFTLDVFKAMDVSA